MAAAKAARREHCPPFLHIVDCQEILPFVVDTRRYHSSKVFPNNRALLRWIRDKECNDVNRTTGDNMSWRFAVLVGILLATAPARPRLFPLNRIVNKCLATLVFRHELRNFNVHVTGMADARIASNACPSIQRF
jgi:hypothetical protein